MRITQPVSQLSQLQADYVGFKKYQFHHYLTLYMPCLGQNPLGGEANLGHGSQPHLTMPSSSGFLRVAIPAFAHPS